MDANGDITEIHEILLNRGDFVEVDAEFDLVVSTRRSLPNSLRVFLTCKQVLRLSSVTVKVTPPPPTPYWTLMFS